MESGSTEVKTQSEEPEIKVEVSIPEICLPFLMSIDTSPSVAIRRLVIGHRNHYAHNREDWIPIADSSRDTRNKVRNYLAEYKREGGIEYKREGGIFDGQSSIIIHQYGESPNHPVWDQDNFDKLILSLMESMETREDIDELFSFLIAYGSEESNKPTAIQLKNRMSKQIAESNPEIWNQHLRKSKARLTIAAKNLNLPKPFGKPYGKSPDRMHPIDEDLLRLLIPWVDGSNERCPISLDGQPHDESISILRDFTPPEFVLG